MPDGKCCYQDKYLSPINELVADAEGHHKKDMVDTPQTGNMFIANAKIQPEIIHVQSSN